MEGGSAGGGVLCVGLLCLDIVSEVDGYPAEDSDTRAMHQSFRLGGNACNNVRVLGELGAAAGATLCAALPAADPLWPTVDALLRRARIGTELCVRRGATNGLPVSTVLINTQNGSRTIVHYRSRLDEITLSEFQAIVDLNSFSWVHFEGRNVDETRKIMEHIAQWRRETGNCVTLSVEAEKVRPPPSLEQLLPLADVAFVSKDFARRHGYGDAKSAVAGLHGAFMGRTDDRTGRPPALCFCGWGAQAAAVTDGSGRVHESPSVPPATGAVVDTLGAGDTFVAAVVSALRRGGTGWERATAALEYGQRVAGSKCGIRHFDGLGEVCAHITL